MMLHTFLDSWSLFDTTYLAAWLMAALLGLAGIPFVIRDQIFIGVAITQSSMLGIGVALWLAATSLGASLVWLDSPVGLTLLAIVFAALTTAITLPSRSSGQTAEGRTGWIYLLAGSLVLVLLARSPVGLNQVNQLVVSSLIGATRGDVIMLLALLVGILLAALYRRDALLLVLVDPLQARAVGLKTRKWELVMALALGVIIGICLRIGGLLLTFGLLVLPGLAARHVCSELRAMLWTAPVLGLLAAIAGFVVGNHWDLPSAALTVVILSLALPAARVWSCCRSRIPA